MLYPLNRYLLVEMCHEDAQDEQEVKILLPVDARATKPAFSKVRILQTHADSGLQQGMCLIVPSHTIEEATVGPDSYYLVLENNFMGFLD